MSTNYIQPEPEPEPEPEPLQSVTIQLTVSDMTYADTDGPIKLQLYNDSSQVMNIYDNNNNGIPNNTLSLNSGGGYDQGDSSTDQFYIQTNVTNFDVKLFMGTNNGVNIKKITITYIGPDNIFEEIDPNNPPAFNTVGWLDADETDNSPPVRWYYIDTEPLQQVTIQLTVSDETNAETDGPIKLQLYDDSSQVMNIYDNNNNGIPNNTLSLNSGGGYAQGDSSTDQFYIQTNVTNFDVKLFMGTNNGVNIKKITITYLGFNIFEEIDSNNPPAFNTVGWLDANETNNTPPIRWYYITYEPGEWVLVFRQTVETDGSTWLWASDQDPKTVSKNETDPLQPQYSVLNNIADYEYNDTGKYHFRYNHFTNSGDNTPVMVNEWKQNTNSLWTGPVTGYEVISVPYTQHGFGGLTKSTNYANNTWLDCATDDTWWSALATIVVHDGGIPGLQSDIAKKVELWAFVYNEPETSFYQIKKLTATNRATDDLFGYSVSINGNYAIVGSSGNNRVFIFERDSNGSWIEPQTLQATPSVPHTASFGNSVSINGNYAIIGAYQNDSSKGSAYIFERESNGTWTQTQQLTASDGVTGDYFGISVSINGNYAIIGANLHDSGKGSAYIFERESNGTWTQTQQLTAIDGDVEPPANGTGTQFGGSVMIDGNYAIICCSGNNTVYIFELDSNGTWTQPQLLLTTGVYQYTGSSVSVNNNYVIIGASGTNTGSAYIFERDGNGTWNSNATINSK